MPRDVLDVTCKFMRDPIRILVKKEELTLEGIKQFFVLVEKEVSYHCLGVLHNFGNPYTCTQEIVLVALPFDCFVFALLCC